jgi:hypothetical protein
MFPMILLAGALGCGVATLALLRSLGPRYRVGRLLAATPTLEIEDARQAAAGRETYVRVTGRISSDEEFPDENDRPLVFRRKRIEIGDGRGGWRVIADEREAVPFGLETRSAFIAVDETAIDAGLVAIPREAGGRLSDLPADLVASIREPPSPDTPARLVIEQLSAVEHATACGTPVLRNGIPTLTTGTGRPLIVTTLEVPAAMRLLAADHRPRVVAAAALLAVAVLLAVASVLTTFAGL